MTSEHDETSPGELQDENEPSAKRMRGFIARQACENCRQKKTRCDEDLPCGLCSSLGLDCHYSSRKATKQEASLGSISRTLQRIEGKINNLAKQQSSPGTSGIPCSPLDRLRASSPAKEPTASDAVDGAEQQEQAIPFSAHLTLFWPGVQSLLPDSVKILCQEDGADYAAALEAGRPPLPAPSMDNAQPGWLSHLSISTVRTLSRLYFSRFNTATPILDQQVYFQQTLATAITGDFPANIETCIVLTVMALGSWLETPTVNRDSATLSEGIRLDQSTSPRTPQESADLPGLVYFNEARRRFGFVDCDSGMQSCQFHLLAALYYAQGFRPADWWVMLNRASTCCKMLLKSISSKTDEWVVDMHSRLFWITVMFEVMITDEFALPHSNLFNHEDQVPLPKFVPPKHLPNSQSNQGVEDGSFFQYHFLSQIAHRLLLTRIRDSIFFSYKGVAYPSPALMGELTSQLETWRQQLPTGLWFDEDAALPSDQSQPDGSAAAWLRARYIVGKYHMGRPLFHRAFQDPGSLTSSDVQICAQTVSHIVQWTSIMTEIESIQGSLPYRWLLCSQLFGQQVIIYCLHVSPDQRLRALMSAKHREWFQFSLSMLSKFANLSKTVQKDLEISRALYTQIERIPL